jgi:hypothetical protein
MTPEEHQAKRDAEVKRIVDRLREVASQIESRELTASLAEQRAAIYVTPKTNKGFREFKSVATITLVLDRPCAG